MNIKEEYSRKYDELLSLAEARLNEYIQIIEPKDLYEPFKYIMSIGGKRIRPVLTMLCCHSVCSEPERALDSAVAVEILHNFTLVHDDIMDKSPIRRGKPTVHTKWGEPLAIIVGDVMVGWAYRLLPSSIQSENSFKIMQEFSTGLIEVCEGQARDMQLNELSEPKMDDYLQMIIQKTAKLLETASVIGAYCGNGTEEEINAVRTFAHNLGIAFQIQDDLLDFTAEQLKLGKKIGQDIVEGKITYLMVKSFELAKDEESLELIKLFKKNKGLTEDYIPQIKNMFEKYNIFELAQNEVEAYLNKAIEALNIKSERFHPEYLLEMASKLNKRNY